MNGASEDEQSDGTFQSPHPASPLRLIPPLNHEYALKSKALSGISDLLDLSEPVFETW